MASWPRRGLGMSPTYGGHKVFQPRGHMSQGDRSPSMLFLFGLPMQLQIPQRHSCNSSIKDSLVEGGGRRICDLGCGMGREISKKSPPPPRMSLGWVCFVFMHGVEGMRWVRGQTMILSKGSVTCTLEVWTTLASNIRPGKALRLFLVCSLFISATLCPFWSNVPLFTWAHHV